MSKWTAAQIPDQSGRVAIVTGANSGLGLASARELARHGATVVLACRDTAKGERAQSAIESDARAAKLELVALDLADLASVESFADGFRSVHDGLDLLINNAGVMAPPRRETKDGFELQLGTNYLGHFALTARLIGAMQGRPGARVVSVSSNGHKLGHINFDDLQGERRYFRWTAYAQSKLADLLFALELDRRLRAAGSDITSVGAHPGYAATNLQTAAPPLIDRLIGQLGNVLVAQSAEAGALPLLYAATEPGLEGGVYVGPDGVGEFRGHPHLATPSSAARDEQVAKRLWAVSEELTGVRFELAAGAAT